jgi:hypothetical protein
MNGCVGAVLESADNGHQHRRRNCANSGRLVGESHAHGLDDSIQSSGLDLWANLTRTPPQRKEGTKELEYTAMSLRSLERGMRMILRGARTPELA